MTRQKSESCVVPEGRRKPAPTRGARPPGGGKAAPVEEADRQLHLFSATADSPRLERGAKGPSAPDRSGVGSPAVPKAANKGGGTGPATMGEVVRRLDMALEKVAANQGAPGPDRQTVHYVRKHWRKVRPVLADSLQRGTYQPGDIRRVWIPKAGGGSVGLASQTWWTGWCRRPYGRFSNRCTSDIPPVQPWVSPGSELPYGSHRGTWLRRRGLPRRG